MKWTKYTYEWYLDNFCAMNRTPKQKHPVYEKFIDLALQEDKLSEHEQLELIKSIHRAFKESLKHENQQ
jgi:hypothetical protein